MYWQSLTSPRLDQVDRRTPVVLPIAAIEQHGPHLPLATDRIINEHFCREVDTRLRDQVLILPTIAVTCSAHHMGFAGTLTVSHETLLAAIVQTLGSAAAHGFRKLAVFNSHGGNQGIARVALEKLGAAHPGCHVVQATWWQLAAEELLPLNESGPGGIGHAGEFETSLVLLAAPELVDESAIQPRQNEATIGWAQGDLLRGPRASLYRTMKQVSHNGVQGEPTSASREKGDAITRIVIDALEQLLVDLRNL